jgi:hypothetical protein
LAQMGVDDGGEEPAEEVGCESVIESHKTTILSSRLSQTTLNLQDRHKSSIDIILAHKVWD